MNDSQNLQRNTSLKGRAAGQMAERGQTFGQPDERFQPPKPEQKPYPYDELNEIIDNLPGEHPLSLFTMVKQGAKGLNTMAAYINGVPMDNDQVIRAASDMGIAATGTSFIRAAGVGAKASRNAVSMFGSFIDDTADPKFAVELAKRTQIAEAMETQGVPAKEIWKEVGLFRNHSKDWTFEVSDKDSSFNFKTLTEHFRQGRDNFTLGEFLNHELLFKVFPPLKDIPVRFDKSLPYNQYGGFRPSTGEIVLNPKTFRVRNLNDSFGTVLHEIQHVIQNEAINQQARLGGSGASPDFAWSVAMKHFKEFEGFFSGKKIKEIEEELKADGSFNEIKIESTVQGLKSMIKVHKLISKVLKKRFGLDFNDIIKDANDFNLDIDTILQAELGMKNVSQEAADKFIDDLKFFLYRGDAGEREARATASRAQFTKEKRREIYPKRLTEENPYLFDMESQEEAYETLGRKILNDTLFPP